MEGRSLDREIVGILFPGAVKNDEKALACIGGVRGISNVYSNMSKKRLGLSYQPENPFIRKIYATSKKSAGVLLKVKVKKTKVGDQIKREIVSTSVMGSVKTMFKFDSLGDFQYMPVHRDEPDAPLRCILDDILPSGLDTSSFMSEPAPLFLIPPSFTRFERPIRYTYTEKRYLMDRSPPDTSERESVHNKVRSLRGTNAAPYIFSLTDDLPTQPNESTLKTKTFKEEISPSLKNEYEIVEKLFQDRPIWSLNLVKFTTKIRGASLKIIMPCLALYHKTGPWRTMWVRFGYDPRKDPASRIYQTLDFRLRHGQGMRTLIMSREEPSARSMDQPGPSKRVHLSEPLSSDDVAEANVLFRPDTVPTQRHILYQYCDVKIPEVEEILNEDPPPGSLCHEKRGWLPASSDEIARDYMFQYVKNTLLSSTNIDLCKLEQGGGSDSEESNSDDDDDDEDDDTRTSEIDNTEDQTDDL